MTRARIVLPVAVGFFVAAWVIRSFALALVFVLFSMAVAYEFETSMRGRSSPPMSLRRTRTFLIWTLVFALGAVLNRRVNY